MENGAKSSKPLIGRGQSAGTGVIGSGGPSFGDSHGTVPFTERRINVDPYLALPFPDRRTSGRGFQTSPNLKPSSPSDSSPHQTSSGRKNTNNLKLPLSDREQISREVNSNISTNFVGHSGFPSVDSGVRSVESGFPPVESGFPPVESGVQSLESGVQSLESMATKEFPDALTSDNDYNPITGLETDYGRLQPLMNDPEIEEIWLNSPNRIFFAKSGISQLSNVVMNAEEVRGLIERLLMWGGRRLDLTNPFVDARLPDGSRLHVAIPEVTAKHWAVNIRKHLVRGSSLAELVELGVLSSEVKEFLHDCVVAGKNILVSGSTQAGKTTLLNALISAAPNKSRVITIEEVFELRLKVADCVALQTRSANLQGEGEIPLRRLIKEALRMRPSRLVVGEIREAESLDLLIALNSGLPGAATIHANSAQDAISKLQTLPLLAGENISHRFITPVVASAIDLVVHISLDNSGKRTITQVLALTGRVEGDRIETEPVFTLYCKNEQGYPEYLRGIGQVEGVQLHTQTCDPKDVQAKVVESRPARGSRS